MTPITLAILAVAVAVMKTTVKAGGFEALLYFFMFWALTDATVVLLLA